VVCQSYGLYIPLFAPAVYRSPLGATHPTSGFEPWGPWCVPHSNELHLIKQSSGFVSHWVRITTSQNMKTFAYVLIQFLLRKAKSHEEKLIWKHAVDSTKPSILLWSSQQPRKHAQKVLMLQGCRECDVGEYSKEATFSNAISTMREDS
jgi:hypothetical protein